MSHLALGTGRPARLFGAPAWGSAGIAFAVVSGDQAAIYLRASSDGGLVRLMREPLLKTVRPPVLAWQPHGGLLGAMDDLAAGGVLRLFDPQTQVHRVVALDPLAFDGLVWSPDGSALATLTSSGSVLVVGTDGAWRARVATTWAGSRRRRCRRRACCDAPPERGVRVAAPCREPRRPPDRGRAPPTRRSRPSCRRGLGRPRAGGARAPRSEGRVDHLPRQLSGGEQQRAAFAMAVVGEPALVATHDPAVVAVAERTYHLRHGSLEAESTSDRPLAVIDQGGRIQLPPAWRDLFPDARARIEIDDDGMRILPP